MGKTFNVTAVCMPDQHYMVNLTERLSKIKALVDDGKYFTINRARQYGKTTTLMALERYLQKAYYVVLIDFQAISSAKFRNENTFSLTFAKEFLRGLKRNDSVKGPTWDGAVSALMQDQGKGLPMYELPELFGGFREICALADKPLVLMVDEIDCVADNQVFLDFLSQLRAGYIRRATQPTFQSVILAGVYDVRNLKRKLRPEDAHKRNSPWNIAADFNITMGFLREDIAGMLLEYEKDYHTGMDIDRMAGMIYEYTSGYPYLVSRLCKLLDEEVGREEGSGEKCGVWAKGPRAKCGVWAKGPRAKCAAWTESGLHEAVRMLLAEKNMLFESLIGKLADFSELNQMLRSLLFTGKSIVYNPDEPAIDIAAMFGFLKNRGGEAVVANRIFETRLYNFYLSAARMQELGIYKASLQDKNQFLDDGHLDMRLILEKFAVHFNDLYGGQGKAFVEEEGRKYFLLYLKPILNGTGNFYIESRTRGLRRTDVVVDYRGEQYVIEMKIWHGEEYNNRAKKQLVGYLNDYHTDKGYLISFCFNKKSRSACVKLLLGIRF